MRPYAAPSRTPTSKAYADPDAYDSSSPLSPLDQVREAYRDGARPAPLFTW